jgi:hypothetical protein
MVANTPKLVTKEYKSHVVANDMVTLWLISINDIIDQVKCYVCDDKEEKSKTCQ